MEFRAFLFSFSEGTIPVSPTISLFQRNTVTMILTCCMVPHSRMMKMVCKIHNAFFAQKYIGMDIWSSQNWRNICRLLTLRMLRHGSFISIQVSMTWETRHTLQSWIHYSEEASTGGKLSCDIKDQQRATRYCRNPEKTICHRNGQADVW